MLMKVNIFHIPHYHEGYKLEISLSVHTFRENKVSDNSKFRLESSICINISCELEYIVHKKCCLKLKVLAVLGS